MCCQFCTDPDQANMWAYAPADLVAAVRFLMRALVLDRDGPDLWRNMPLVLGVRLREHQRGLVARAALGTLNPVVVDKITCDVLRRAGCPLPPLRALKEEADFWASLATRAELKIYADVIYRRFSPAEQKAFIRHVTRGAAA